MNKNELVSLLKQIDLEKNQYILIKFEADWCKPCQKIKPLYESLTNKLRESKNINIFEIDIDNNMELYGKLKQKKMIKGIPSILLWHSKKEREYDYWYIPDKIATGPDEKNIKELFANITI